MQVGDVGLDSAHGPIQFEIDGHPFTRTTPDITVQGLLDLAEVPSSVNRILRFEAGEQIVFVNLDEKLALINHDRFETTRVYVYFVDTEEQVSITDHRTVLEILTDARIDPATHYLVELRGHEQIELRDLKQTIHLREHEKFISIYSGPTPVS